MGRSRREEGEDLSIQVTPNLAETDCEGRTSHGDNAVYRLEVVAKKGENVECENLDSLCLFRRWQFAAFLLRVTLIDGTENCTAGQKFEISHPFSFEFSFEFTFGWKLISLAMITVFSV